MLLMMGIYMGSVTIIIVSGSMKVPIKMSRICITIKSAIEGIGSPPANSINPELAPVKAKICEKAMAPVKIMNIIIVISKVPEIDSFTTFQFHPLYKNAKMKHPTAPRAEDSVGVAIPRNMRPITRKTMDPRGNMYLIVN